MDAVAKMGEIIKETASLTAQNGSIGCAKLVVFCNAVEDNPFIGGRVSRRRRRGMCYKCRGFRARRGEMRAGKG